MSNRKVTVDLQLATGGFVPNADAAAASIKGVSAAEKEASASTKELTASQAASSAASIEAAKVTQQLTIAKREAISAARDAAAADAESSASLVAAQKEAEAATKDTTELGVARRAAAQEAMDAAKQEAAAAAEAKTAADAQVSSSTAALTAHRDSTTAAKLDAAAMAAASKTSTESAEKQSAAYTSTGKVMLGVGAGLVGAFVLAEKATSDFNKSLSGVQAVSSASATDMDQLRAAALQAGKDTAFTATEAADAEGELVKAGVSVANVLGGALQGALSLAAAGGLGLADAATIAANAMNTFGLKGQDVSHIADVYAAAANKSAADVSTLAYAMQQGGLVAAQTGLTFEDTTAILAAFADRGLQGADAGTSLKTMLEKLNAPTSQAKSLMQQLGIVTYDASGKFVGITQFAGELHDKLGVLSDAQRNQALSTIFGSDAIRAASVLYNLGADGVKGYSQAVNDNGAAQRMAAAQMDNLSGDLQKLKGSLNVALIQGGSGANVVLRDMAQNAMKAVNAFANLPKPLQEATVGFAGGAGTSLLLVGGLTSLAGKLGSTKKALSEASEAASGMKGALASAGSFMMGPWGLAIAGAATVVGIFASKHNEAKVAVSSFTDSIKADGDAIGKTTTQAVAADLASKGLFTSFNQLGISSTAVTDAAMHGADAMKQLETATIAAATGADGHTKVSLKQMTVIAGNLQTVKAYSGALQDQLKSQQLATAATQTATDATGTSAADTEAATKAAKELAATLYAQAGGRRAVFDADTADATASKDVTVATVAHTAAKVSNASATSAATAAAKAHTTATKADATTQKDSAKASTDQSKADTDAAKASTAAANAAKVNGDANSTASEKKKANSAASSAATKATKAQTTADTAASRASDAASSAADKHTAANSKSAKASSAAAGASSKQSAADSDAAKAAAAAAETARQATEVHKIGTQWLLAVADAEAEASGGSRDLDSSVQGEVDAMNDAKTAASDLQGALDALNGVHIAAGKAALDEQQKVADLTKALSDNGKTLDITTDKGRANMGAVYDLATAINSHAQSVTEETGSVEAGSKAMDASRKEFDAVLKQAGLTTDQIDAFNKSLLNTPKLAPVTIQVQADTTAAAAALASLEKQYGGTGLVFGGHHIVPGYSSGGMVTGRGTGTSDSNLIAASTGEYIFTAASVARIGVNRLEALQFGGGNTTIVKPNIPMTALAASPSAARSGGSALNIENYYERGANPQQIANELSWLAGARGAPL